MCGLFSAYSSHLSVAIYSVHTVYNYVERLKDIDIDSDISINFIA